MKVKGRDRSMLVVGNAGKQRFTEYFYAGLTLAKPGDGRVLAAVGQATIQQFNDQLSKGESVCIKCGSSMPMLSSMHRPAGSLSASCIVGCGWCKMIEL